MTGSYISLGDHAAAGYRTLPVACRRCERRGRYNVRRLIERYGRDYSLHQLMADLSADCPKQQSVSIYDRCGIHLPGAANHTLRRLGLAAHITDPDPD